MSDSQWHEDQAIGERAQREWDEERRKLNLRIISLEAERDNLREALARIEKCTTPGGEGSLANAIAFVALGKHRVP